MTEQNSTPKPRRAVLRAAGLAAIATPVGLAAGAFTSAKAQDKLAGSMVMYQQTPKDGQQCNTCLHWQAPNACAIVAGVISPTGWCAVWAKKEG